MQGAPDIFNKKSGLDVKKPSLSAVEEASLLVMQTLLDTTFGQVRQALGVPGSSNAGSSNQPSRAPSRGHAAYAAQAPWSPKSV